MQQRTNLHRELDRLFNDFSRGFATPAPMTASEQYGLMPDMDVHEADGKITLTMELPGVAEKDVDISVDDNLLTISGEKRSETESGTKNTNSYRSERSFGSFSRSMSLPFRIDPDKVEARFDNGLLKITVPRPEGKDNGVKRIAIRH